MAYWLAKSEPDAYSWDQLVADGGTAWTGIRNHQAKLNLKAMKPGDRVFFYHSNVGKAVVGVAEVTRESYPDPTAKDGGWLCVDLKPVSPFPTPVTLDAIKAEPRLAEMVLVKNSRLSVQPVTAEEWTLVTRMGGWRG